MLKSMDKKCTFWANLVQKTKIVSQHEIWHLHVSEYAEFDGDVQLSCFGLEIPFFGKFGPKIQNYVFKMKFGT